MKVCSHGAFWLQIWLLCEVTDYDSAQCRWVGVLLGQIQFCCGYQCCQMAKFDPFLSLNCTRVEDWGGGHNSRKGGDQILQLSVA